MTVTIPSEVVMQIKEFIRTSTLILAASTASICLAEDFSESIDIPDSQWRVDTQCSTVSKATQCAISVSDGEQEEKVLDYPEKKGRIYFTR